MAISGLVITYNEQKNIGDCIDSLFRVCDEVIVVDSISQDATLEIAKQKGAKVYLQEFLGDGKQRLFGLQYCEHDWILNLDADERLDEDTYAFIASEEYLNMPYDAYNLKMRNFLGTKEINFSGWYPDYTCRFFNKQTATLSTAKVHQRVIAKNMKNTNLNLLHYAWSDFYHIIAKKNTYTTWQAEELFEKGIKVRSYAPLTHGFTSLFKCYFFKKGVFNGLDGFTFALIQAFFSYMKYAKLIKLHKNEKRA
ncbi:Glycosyltransferase involved in cell wall bisynthesis [Arenibacter nanhaiticus]|uniref:Glycosyltransferase involved in cell wall bisynthesis n=1 Tax=Arenibacter nanhaiticus TaxID=558155 RepID=A0A1M6BE18_9FLAO|nr:glycosyltransferase family 2 protein [Arenibacter nanhaiticus]SHI46955.1 Glycosyltransferase involved in cell wall bisynthesis [Arenibacter nanhaiticus]